MGGLEVLNGVSCPSTSWCEAVGATSINGEGALVPISQGRPGARQLVPGTKELTGVSCVSQASCEAVGDGGGHGVAVAIEHGTAGSAQPVLGMSTLSSIACSGKSCEGGGRSLSEGAIASGPTAVLTVQGTTAVDGIDCWASGVCEAVASTSNGKYNSVLVSLESDQLGPLRTVPPGTTTFGAIACGGPAGCVAAGQGVSRVKGRVGQAAAVVDIPSGATPRLSLLPGTPTTSLQSVSCPSTSFCEVIGNSTSQSHGVAVQRGVFLAVNGGTPGTLRSVPGQALQLTGISCPTTASCQVVGENETTRAAEVATLTVG